MFPCILFGQGMQKWNGYEILDFEQNGIAAKIVFPKQVNQHRNWIWRARFWGHEPQADIALLEKGFHVVWIDMTDLFGSERAVKIGNDFYWYLRNEYKLHEKVALEGFSRGGLFVYNWALSNLDKVACIYADAPVLDIKSWPGGLGVGKGAPKEWIKCKKVYGLSDQEILSYHQGPIYDARALAVSNIPILHICGATDVVVPYMENTKRLEDSLAKYNADIKVILKEGVGHHPHSLANPRPIVRFVLEHTDPGLLTDADLLKVSPKINYRERWHNSAGNQYSDRPTRIAFLGGSITYGGGWRDSIMHYLRATFPEINYEFINAGISSMGSTPGSFRLQRDVLSRGPIDLLFVEAAVNDATNGRSVKAQIRGMEGIVRQTLKNNPSTDIIMMHFVDQDKMADYNQGRIPTVIQSHEKIAQHYSISSINLAEEVNDRILNGEFSWAHDFKNLHPSAFGHGIYFHSMSRALDQLFSKGKLEDLDLPNKFDPYCYSSAGLIDIERARLFAGWQYIDAWQPSDSLGTRDGFVNIPALVALEPGASLSLEFTGTAIGILVPAGGDVGKLKYKIDDSPAQEIDQFTKWSHFLHLPWLYVLDDELTAGPHKLTISTSGEKNEQSKGHACRILYFAVNEGQ